MKVFLVFSRGYIILNIFDRIKFQLIKDWGYWINICFDGFWFEFDCCF